MTREIDIVIKGDDKVIKSLTLFDKKLSDNSDSLKVIGTRIKNNIFIRTNAGKDFNFKPFKPYSPKYAKKNNKTTVNLTLTGEMLNTMVYRTLAKDKGKIFFSTADAREKATWHNITGAGRSKIIREFFGVNDKDNESAVKELNKEVNRVQKEVGL